jgi:hypothetical protein
MLKFLKCSKVPLILKYLVSVAAESKVGLLFKGLRLFGDLVPRARHVPTPETALQAAPSTLPPPHSSHCAVQFNGGIGLKNLDGS